MDESKKKPLMIGIIVLCLAVAVGVTVKRSSQKSGGIESISEERMTWILCRNPDCEASYEMPLKEYFKYARDNPDPMTGFVSVMKCGECGEDSVYVAYKCPKCGLVFEAGTVINDFSDRCPNPECKYSADEAGRHEAKEKRKSVREQEAIAGNSIKQQL